MLKESRENVKSSHKEDRFTALGLTTASGELVMVIVIFLAKEMTFVHYMGHDVRAIVPFSTKQSPLNGTQDLAEPFQEHQHVCSGVRKSLLLSLAQKKEVASVILREAFKRLEDLGVYNRTEGRTPIDLFDAHDSRLQCDILRYVNDDAHL